MTLPDTMDKENVLDLRRTNALGLTLMRSLKQALRRKGLTCGLKACAELLKSDPSSVMMCILPSKAPVNIDIHHILIKAFCHENNISIFHVDNEHILETFVKNLKMKGRGRVASGANTDISCVMIQFPKLKPSKEDTSLIHYYDEIKGRWTPIIALPD